MTSSNSPLSLLSASQELLRVLASGLRPCKADHSGVKLDGDRGVGAYVYVSTGVNRPGEIRKVVHVGAEAVQEDDERVGQGGSYSLGYTVR